MAGLGEFEFCDRHEKELKILKKAKLVRQDKHGEWHLVARAEQRLNAILELI